MKKKIKNNRSYCGFKAFQLSQTENNTELKQICCRSSGYTVGV